MPSDSYVEWKQKPFSLPGRYQSLTKTRLWDNSPKLKGKIQLRCNNFSYHLSQELSYSATAPIFVSTYPPGCWLTLADAGSFGTLQSVTYGKLRGKLYKGSANLGVTLGEFNQSASMIRRAYRQISREATEAIIRLSQIKKRHHLRNAADRYLEVIFGWRPLLQDIGNSVSNVVLRHTPDQVVSARSSGQILSAQGNGRTSGQYVQGTKFVNQGVVLSVQNPNAWLANRLGLLNPLAVAWDLVPGSFIVNMFVNVNQLVQSVSDSYGLDVKDGYLTVGCQMSGARFVVSGVQRLDSRVKYVNIQRKPDRFSAPPLVFHNIKADWSTALTVAALATQRATSLIGLVKGIR